MYVKPVTSTVVSVVLLTSTKSVPSAAAVATSVNSALASATAAFAPPSACKTRVDPAGAEIRRALGEIVTAAVVAVANRTVWTTAEPLTPATGAELVVTAIEVV